MSTADVPVATIEFSYCECTLANDLPPPFVTFAAAEAWIRAQARRIVEYTRANRCEGDYGYRKADFVITWADGFKAIGKYDIEETDCRKDGQFRDRLGGRVDGHALRDLAPAVAA